MYIFTCKNISVQGLGSVCYCILEMIVQVPLLYALAMNFDMSLNVLNVVFFWFGRQRPLTTHKEQPEK